MVTTIDKAGRVVIPAAARAKAGFTPGSELEVQVDEVGVRLVRKAAGPTLRRVGKRWVAKPTAKEEARPDIAVADLVEEERSRWPWQS